MQKKNSVSIMSMILIVDASKLWLNVVQNVMGRVHVSSDTVDRALLHVACSDTDDHATLRKGVNAIVKGLFCLGSVRRVKKMITIMIYTESGKKVNRAF